MRKKGKTALSLNMIYYRKMARLTQAEVAAALGVDRSTYAYYESGSTPHPEILFKLASIYKISAGRFLECENSEYVSANNEIFGDLNFMQSFNELSDSEKQLILNYRALSDSQKTAADKAIKTIAEKDK